MWFLQQRQKHKSTPKQLKVQHFHQTDLNPELTKKWKDIENRSSLKLLSISIQDAEANVKNFENLFLKKRMALLEQIKDAGDWADICEHIESVAACKES